MIENGENDVRLIDANALLEDMTECLDAIYVTSGDVLFTIKNAPTIEPKQYYNKGYADAVQDIANEIIRQGKYIASDESKQEWIPCEERLPDEYEWIGTKQFGTTISDTVFITFDVDGQRFVKSMSLQNGELSRTDKKIMDAIHKGWEMIAWMPLPEPYEGNKR